MAVGFSFVVSRSGNIAVKVEPSPSLLWTEIFPPISSTSWCVIESPSPVPPKRRAIELSAWVNVSNIVPTRSAEIPIPLSLTSIRKVEPVEPWFTPMVNSTWPWSVNLMALPIRLIKIWRSLSASPTIAAGTSSPTSALSIIPFARAPGSISRITPRTVCLRSTFSSAICIRPASIFEISRMAFNNCIIDRPDSAIISTCSR